MKKYEMDKIMRYFDHYETIKEDELKKLLLQLYPDRNPKYYYYHLLDFYRNNLLFKYNTGVLKPVNDRGLFVFNLPLKSEVVEQLKNIQPAINISVWSLGDLTQYMSLQMFENIIFVETFSYAKEALLNSLLDSGLNAIYEEDYDTFSKYSKKGEVYIIKRINEDSPIMKPRFQSLGQTDRKPSFITVPKIEKIVVDLVIDEFFETLLGDEIGSIIRHILKRYQVNFSSVLRYANKKHKLDYFLEYVDSLGFDINRGEFNDFR